MLRRWLVRDGACRGERNEEKKGKGEGELDRGGREGEVVGESFCV